MNYLFRKQVATEIPENDPVARISEIAERSVSLGEQLCFVRWDGRVYDNIKASIADLDEAATALDEPRIRAQVNDVKSLLSGFGAGIENKEYSNFSALTESLQQTRALVGELRGIDNNSQATMDSSELMRDSNRVIAFLGEEQALDEYIHWLERAGFEVIHISLPEDLPGLFDKREPVALIVDLSSCEDESGMLTSVAPVLQQLESSNRLVFLSRRADQEIRLRAVQAGGDAFLTMPLVPQLLIQHLELAVRMRRHDYRVMLIGDSNMLTSSAAPGLEKAGMTVKCLNNASQALLSAINFSPDLLIIEHALSDCSGCELGRVIHQLSDYEYLPVIYTGASKKQARDHGPDYACEWVSPEFLMEQEFIGMVDSLVCASRLRMNRVRQLQSCDPVTGLVNRQGFFQLIERGIFSDGDAALLLVDFDNLQQRYPRLSPQLVDRFIALISRRLDKLVLSQGQSARIGDYTFACLIYGKTPDEIRQLGQFLSHSLATHIFDVEHHSFMVVCRIGIAITDAMHADGMSLFNLAMHACEEARRAGNNRVSIRSLEASPVTRVVSADKGMLELVQDAISSDGFRLVYQPIASLRGSAVEKYEVLLRLDSDKGGTISPRLFIPVAEENGLMELVDRWVVEHTIQVLQQHGYDSQFFVKVSSVTLRDSGYTPFLKDCLTRYGAAGERLVFEISASSVGEEMRYVTEFALQVRRLGCAVSIDHHDISQDVTQILEHIQASYVKLDGDALKHVTDDQKAQDRLRTIINQAEQKSARTIAGFVEDSDRLHLLWQTGIHYIQGNFLQEPNESLGFEFGVEGTVQEHFPA